jgi:hypothetical protein
MVKGRGEMRFLERIGQRKKIILIVGLLSIIAVSLFIVFYVKLISYYDSESDFKVIPDTDVSGGVTITKYLGSKREVRIPPSIQNLPVTSIGELAFSRCTSLASTSITIPNSVIRIEDKAFSGCTSLVSVNIPNSVTNIGNKAFSGCYRLTSITIPNSVTRIGDNSFQNCTTLASITIPDSITTIETMAFYGCKSLTSVTFQGTIPSVNFSTTNIFFSNEPFDGDLRTKFYLSNSANGTPGTYTRLRGSIIWTKLPFYTETPVCEFEVDFEYIGLGILKYYGYRPSVEEIVTLDPDLYFENELGPFETLIYDSFNIYENNTALDENVKSAMRKNNITFCKTRYTNNDGGFTYIYNISFDNYKTFHTIAVDSLTTNMRFMYVRLNYTEMYTPKNNKEQYNGL